MLNLMVFLRAWQCFLNLFLHYILLIFQVVKIIGGGGGLVSPPPPPPIDASAVYNHHYRDNDNAYREKFMTTVEFITNITYF